MTINQSKGMRSGASSYLSVYVQFAHGLAVVLMNSSDIVLLIGLSYWSNIEFIYSFSPCVSRPTWSSIVCLPSFWLYASQRLTEHRASQRRTIHRPEQEMNAKMGETHASTTLDESENLIHLSRFGMS